MDHLSDAREQAIILTVLAGEHKEIAESARQLEQFIKAAQEAHRPYTRLVTDLGAAGTRRDMAEAFRSFFGDLIGSSKEQCLVAEGRRQELSRVLDELYDTAKRIRAAAMLEGRGR
jgi:hypothetical protein